MAPRISLLAAAVLACSLSAFAQSPLPTQGPRYPDGIPSTMPAAPRFKIPDGYVNFKVDDATAAGRMVLSARRMLAALVVKEEVQPFTPEFLALKFGAARKLLEAELLAAKTPDERLAALQTHLAVAELTRRRIFERLPIDADAVAYFQADYAVAEAEYLLEKETKK